jgi:hypothetical protein
VVVLGILIALSGEQLIEMLHWHHQVKDTETSLTHELASNIEDSIARMRTMDCLERRLDEISRHCREESHAAASGHYRATVNIRVASWSLGQRSRIPDYGAVWGAKT